MTAIDIIKESIQGFLPAAMEEYWYAVPAWGLIIFILIIVLIVRVLKNKNGTQKIEQFKQQNLQMPQKATQTAIPKEHKSMMEQHNVHIPHQKYEQLDKYIDAMIKRQMDPQMIRIYLHNVGWDPQVVEEAFSRLQNR